MNKLKKILTLSLLVAMFIFIAYLDKPSNTNEKDIASAKIQAQVNRESRCK